MLERLVYMKPFAQLSDLSRRLIEETSPTLCQLCQKYFSLLSNMKRNERIHMGEDRFFAIYVIDQLVIYCSRNSYVLIHSRDKSYICHLGSRPFISRGTLTLHIRCHDGVTLSDTQRNAMDRSA